MLFVIITGVHYVFKSERSLVYAGSEDKLYLSESCTYCKSVSDFIEKYNINDEINYETVYINDEASSDQFIASAMSCNITNPQVPLFYYGGLCYMGDSAVINKIIELTGISTESATDEEASDVALEVSENVNQSDDSIPTEENTNDSQTENQNNIEERETNANTEIDTTISKTPLINIILIIVAPLSFIALFALIIKSLKL
ncbi:MAG TPA: hypothetical protein PLX79_03015 [Candidatus Dojkabacteria bacterium]|nr:hypothetical protein [Candidatus Dojkabacteria bacterium]